MLSSIAVKGSSLVLLFFSDALLGVPVDCIVLLIKLRKNVVFSFPLIFSAVVLIKDLKVG